MRAGCQGIPCPREGWEGAGLPLRTAAAHCSRRQSSRASSCGTLGSPVPRRQ